MLALCASIIVFCNPETSLPPLEIEVIAKSKHPTAGVIWLHGLGVYMLSVLLLALATRPEAWDCTRNEGVNEILTEHAVYESTSSYRRT